MIHKLAMEEAEPRTIEAFPSHEFRHRYFLTDENGERVEGKVWRSGDFFDWKTQLAPPKPDKDWFEFAQDIEQMLSDGEFFRKQEIPRLQKKEEALEAKVKDLDFHLSVRKKDLGKKLNHNPRNAPAYFVLRDYEARFTLLHGLAQLAQVQAQVIDLITACVIRRIQARMKYLLPLFAKVFLTGEGEDAEGKIELYVWHPYTDDKGNIIEEYMQPDSFRDYPLILQQVMEPGKYRELLVKRKAEAAQKENGGIVIAGDAEVRSMANFKKKFLDKPKENGGLAK